MFPAGIGCDHGSLHPDDTIIEQIEQIKNSDYVLAYFNRTELYGTLTELFIASKFQKKIIIILKEELILCPTINEAGDSITDVYKKVTKTRHGCGCMISSGQPDADGWINPATRSDYWYPIKLFEMMGKPQPYKTEIYGTAYNFITTETQIFTISEWDEIYIQEIMKKVFDEKVNEEDVQSFEKDLIESEFKNDFVSKTNISEKTILTYKRNKKLSKEIKQIYSNKCQICGFTFKKISGENYSETHHLISLGKDGSDELKNLVCVCPNCHKKLHYAKTELGKFSENILKIKINEEQKEIKYKMEHFKLIFS